MPRKVLVTLAVWLLTSAALSAADAKAKMLLIGKDPAMPAIRTLRWPIARFRPSVCNSIRAGRPPSPMGVYLRAPIISLHL
jgi:hypothetical protein